jgi:TatD DNase family protein
VLVDSHCHLNYLADADASLAAARSVGVGGFLCIGVNADAQRAVIDLAERHADVWASAGLHPESAGGGISLDWVREAARHERVVGIGETGLDYFQLNDFKIDADDVKRGQRESFAAHLDIAREASLPVIVHTRAAEADTLELLRLHKGTVGVLHCFTESWELARGALDLGWYVSISGIVTFKNAQNVRDVAARVPADRLLVETDCPWLAPVPHRGKTNEPAFVTHTAQFLAMMRGQAIEAFAEQTTANFHRLFARTNQERTNSSS